MLIALRHVIKLARTQVGAMAIPFTAVDVDDVLRIRVAIDGETTYD